MKKTFLSLGLKEHSNPSPPPQEKTYSWNCPTVPPKTNLWGSKKSETEDPKKLARKIEKKNGLSARYHKFYKDLYQQKIISHYDGATIDEWYEGFIKDNPNGKLTPETFVAFYSKMFPSPTTDKLAAHLFRGIDCNRDGYVDFTEWYIGLDTTRYGTPEAKLNLAFVLYDANDDQKIELGEFKSGFDIVTRTLNQKNENPHSESVVEKIFKDFDLDKDGTISRNEFFDSNLQNADLVTILNKGRYNPDETWVVSSPKTESLSAKTKQLIQFPLPAETEKLILSLQESLSKLIEHHL